MFCCYNLPLARPAQAKNVLKKKCCITVIRCYKYSLFGNKTNPVDLSLSVAIEVSGFGTCFLQWQRDFFQHALIINYCKRIVVTQLVVQTVCSANSFAKEKKIIRWGLLSLGVGVFFGTIFPALFVGQEDYSRSGCQCDNCLLSKLNNFTKPPYPSHLYLRKDPGQSYNVVTFHQG